MNAGMVRRVGSGLVVMVSVVTAALGVGSPPASASATPRVTGYVYSSNESARNSGGAKEATASCPVGKQVLGGGGYVSGEPSTAQRVALTAMMPYRSSTGRWSYLARAAEVYIGTSRDWAVVAYVFCADPVPGHQVVTASTERSSTAVKATIAACPAGTSALGTGATINFSIFTDPDGHPVPAAHGIGLQVVRATGTGDAVRAQAHEAPEGYPHDWHLVGYAVCAQTPYKYQIRYGGSEANGSETFKAVNTDECSNYVETIGLWPSQRTVSKRRLIVGVGGAVTNTAPGHVTLSGMQPLFWLIFDEKHEWVNARAYENTPTTESWTPSRPRRSVSATPRPDIRP